MLKNNRSMTFIAMNIFSILFIVIPKDCGAFFGILPIRLFLIACLTLVFIWDLFRKNIVLNTFNLKWFLIPYAVFLVLAIPSVIVSKNLVISIYTLLKYIAFFFVFYIFSRTKLESKDYKILIKSFLVATLIAAVLGILQYIFEFDLNLMGIDKYDIRGRIVSTFFNPIYYGIFINMIFLFIIFVYREKIVKTKWLMILLILLYAGLILTFTRSAILIFLILFIANLIFNFKMIVNKMIIGVLIICAVCTILIPSALFVAKNALYYGSEMVFKGTFRSSFTIGDTDDNTDATDDNTDATDVNTDATEASIQEELEEENATVDSIKDASLRHRAELAIIAKSISYDNRINGVGFGAYIDYMRSDSFKEHYPDYNGYIDYPHSGFVMLAAETGYPATVFFIVSMGMLGLMLFIIWIKNIKRKGRVYKLVTISLTVFTGFFAVAYLAENPFYDTQVFPILLVLLGLVFNYNEKVKNAKPIIQGSCDKQYKVSIIVPVYNMEKYLDKCLESLVNQTLDGIEIIVVNDGSTDNSLKIIDKYAKEYSGKLTVYTKANGGLSDARNYGMALAKGEYYAFVDSDDWVEKDMYTQMYKKAKTNDFDLVVCDVNYVYPNKIKCVSSKIEADINDLREIKKSFLTIFPAAWNKLFKRELLETNVTFTKGVWFEDVEYMYKLLPSIKSIGTIKRPFYQYLQRENSITYTYDSRLYHFISNFDRVINYYKENNNYEDYKKELEYCYVRYGYATFITRLARTRNSEVFKQGVCYVIEKVKEKFPNYRKNIFFYMTGIKGVYLLMFNKYIAKILYWIKR